MKKETKLKISKANTGKKRKKKEPIPDCCRCICLTGCAMDEKIFKKCPCNLHKAKHKLVN